ncbi:hypothetical protein, partial [Faecalibaculum rodentium]
NAAWYKNSRQAPITGAAGCLVFILLFSVETVRSCDTSSRQAAASLPFFLTESQKNSFVMSFAADNDDFLVPDGINDPVNLIYSPAPVS